MPSVPRKEFCFSDCPLWGFWRQQTRRSLMLLPQTQVALCHNARFALVPFMPPDVSDLLQCFLDKVDGARMQGVLFRIISMSMEDDISDDLLRDMAAEVAMSISLSVRRAAAERSIFALLTDREGEVMRLVGGGWTNAEIGDYLAISERTVRQHLENMQIKLGVHGRGKLVAIAFGLTTTSTVSAETPI